jgi:glycerol kinase
MPHTLCLDQGGHASRAIVFDGSGDLVTQVFAPIGTRRPAEGHVEHDGDEIVESFRDALADLDQQLGPGIELKAAGLATQRSSVVCWDRTTGRPLSPVLSWQDRRNAAFVDSLHDKAAWVHEKTGLVLSPHYGASKLRWCLEKLPRVSAAASAGRLAMGPLSSFILFSLLEEHPFFVDPANASRTQLWDPATRDWAPALLETFGVAREYLPQPVTSRHVFGSLKVGSRVVPLAVCTGDQSTVPYAFGPVDENMAYVNMGTGAFIQCAIRAPRRAWPLLTSVVWADSSTVTYVLEGSVNGASSALDWLSETDGIDAHRMLNALPADAAHADTSLVFLNGVSGLASPFWIANFPTAFVGTGSAESRFHAVLESILFLVRANLDEMQRQGARLQGIVIAGGLSSSDFLCQRLADVVALPVARHDVREATARGLAFLAAGQPEDWKAPAGTRQFEPRNDPALRARFVNWLNEMKRAM